MRGARLWSAVFQYGGRTKQKGESVMKFFKLSSPRPSTRYNVGDFEIELPEGHALPAYQAQHPLYDRFVTVLGEVLPDRALVVDVGANVGDTAAAFCCGRARKRIVCIEPSELFYAVLERNAAVLRSRGHQVTCLRKLIGLPGFKGQLLEDRTTAKVVLSESGVEIEALDDIRESGIGDSDSEIILLKSDTDGYDADVILSAKSTISKSKPLLFWETEVPSKATVSKYHSMLKMIHHIGYDRFSVFDNFGNVMFETKSVDSVFDVCKYVLTVSLGLGTRALYYVDVLASTEKYRDIHADAIDLFRKRYLDEP